jgi:hypothetical protein
MDTPIYILKLGTGVYVFSSFAKAMNEFMNEVDEENKLFSVDWDDESAIGKDMGGRIIKIWRSRIM